MEKSDADQTRFMRRCIDLAAKAGGMTYPNPLVGAVIVHEGKIIGEGYHVKAGLPHAEVNAVNSVVKKELLPFSVLHVSLEPCSHEGRTPPCADFIISSGIRRVVIGTPDTSEKVSGNGISRMIDAGCEVECGVMEKECRWINRRFFTYHEKKRPYIILKWAESADGFIDRERETGEGKTPAQVTGMPERVLVHRWRAEEQSILAGAATIRADDPLLNVRYWTGNDPLRVILSGSGVMDNKARVFNAPGSAVVFTRDHGKVIPGSVVVKLSGDISAAGQISDYLYGMGIQSLFIEGGAVVLNHFISEGTWDEARVFTGADPLFKGVKAPSVKGTLICRQEFNRSCLKVILNDPGKKSEEVDNFNKIV